MRYYIIAGEASGDLHASNLMAGLKKIDAHAEFRCWGGDRMKAQGAEIVKHISEISFMGFVEVAMNLKTILRNLKLCKNDIIDYKPDAVILIDYPGFNMRIAEFAHHAGFKVHYYISPQVWAWKQSRVKKIRKYVDQMYVILPFEKDFYKNFSYEVDFVGHPLLDAIEEYDKNHHAYGFREQHSIDQKPIIAVLPGSRKQEISKMLRIMLTVVDTYPDYNFIVAAAPSVPLDFYHEIIKNARVQIIAGKTYEIIQNSVAAMVTSGTATLETALFEIPEVVCYKGSAISYFIARKLVKVNYISLVNLIADRQIVLELIQHELNTSNLKVELEKLLNDKLYRATMIDNYKNLKQLLGGTGASDKAAALIFNSLNQ